MNYFPNNKKNVVKEGKCNKNEHNLGIMFWWLCDLLLYT